MDEELIQISNEIFQNVISQLTLHLRFMDIALNRYIFVPDGTEFRCDGKFFHYSPITVIKMFQNDPKSLTRGYFHVVLHSIFQHPYFAEQRKMSLWDLAGDMAVENVILDLNLECMALENDDQKQRELDKLKEKVPDFTAQNIYRYLTSLQNDEIKLLAGLFEFDTHDIWYTLRDVKGSSETLFGDEVKDDSTHAGNNRFDKASHDTGERKEGEDPNADDEQLEMIKNALKDWKEISEKIEMDLELFHKENGKMDAMVQSLKKLHREKYNYTKFLKLFMTTGEKMQINDEDFDTIFYTYGLKLYSNLPLIEPLESKEIHNIRELVIAIDTSGSVQGDVVQSFLQKTFNIFEQRENFFSYFNIHILQCDMLIRESMVIHTANEFQNYIDHMEIKGLGGTDFRPVFQYVDERIADHTFKKLGGLLYFTDGDGIYPKYSPSYRTAFLFPEDNKDVQVPPWAIRYNLGGD